MNTWRITGLTVALCATVACSAADATAPEQGISIVSPRPGSRFDVGDTVPIVVVPDDPAGDQMTVRFWADERPIAVDSVPPYEARWAITEETPLHPQIRIQATTPLQGTTTQSVEVEVDWRYRRPPETDDGWPTATLAEVGLDEPLLTGLVGALRGSTSHLIHGIVIVRHGKLVFEKYFAGLSHPTFGEQPVAFGPETLHGTSSVTKSFTSTLLGVALERGCVGGVSDPVFDYFPGLGDLEEGSKAAITLEDLLTMRSGLSWDETTYPFTDERNDLTAWLRGAASGASDPARAILEHTLVAVPGTAFNYSGGDYNLLGNAIQRGCGQRLDLFASDALFEPLRIRDSWWWIFPGDFVYASGDLALRPRDMAKLGQLYLQDGVLNGERILPAGWVEAATESISSYHELEAQEGIVGYGYGLWTLSDEYGQGAYQAWGWGGQYIVVMPEHDMVVALTGGSYWVPAPWSALEIMRQYVLPAILP